MGGQKIEIHCVSACGRELPYRHPMMVTSRYAAAVTNSTVLPRGGTPKMTSVPPQSR